MARYKHTDNSQGLFLTVNLQEQLLPDTFEWTIDYLINKIDISSFEQKYNNDNLGAAAYSPRVLLKIILYCYSKGIITSRKIEKACKDNIIVKALAEDCEPDHSTIAEFISINDKAVNDLFAQILLQCSHLKLITGEMFAIDGCKLPSNASKEWSGKFADLKKKRDKLEKYINRLLLKHKELDKDENAKNKLEKYRNTMGEDKQRRKNSVEKLENKLEKLNNFFKISTPKIGISGEEVQSNITDIESAIIKSPHGYIQGYNGITIADSGNQVIICAEAIGSGAESGAFPKMLDSLNENMKMVTKKKKPLRKALLHGDTNYFTEDNLQEAAKRKIDVLIPDPQFRQRDPYFAEKKDEKVKKKHKKTYSTEDFTYNRKTDSFVCPAGKTLYYKCDATLRNNSGRQYRARPSDCVNCSLIENCIKRRNSKKPARALYIVYQKYDKNLSEEMRDKIDKPVNRELYSRRMQIIEPVFSHMTYCKGMNRFTMRTQKKVSTQWQLFCIVHNMWKCMKALSEKYGR